MNKEVELKITRVKKLMGFAISFDVFIDDNYIGKLKNGKNLTCNISLGTHKVLFKCVEKNIIQDINITPTTNSVEIITHAKIGLIAALCNIDEVKYN